MKMINNELLGIELPCARQEQVEAMLVESWTDFMRKREYRKLRQHVSSIPEDVALIIASFFNDGGGTICARVERYLSELEYDRDVAGPVYYAETVRVAPGMTMLRGSVDMMHYGNVIMAERVTGISAEVFDYADLFDASHDHHTRFNDLGEHHVLIRQAMAQHDHISRIRRNYVSKKVIVWSPKFETTRARKVSLIRDHGADRLNAMYDARRLLSIVIKAELMRLILLDRIVTGASTTLGEIVKRQTEWWWAVIEGLCAIIVMIIHGAFAVVATAVDVTLHYGGQNAQSLIEAGLIGLSLYMLYQLGRLLHRFHNWLNAGYTLRVAKNDGSAAKFVQKRTLGNSTVFEFIINGELITVPIVDNQTGIPVEEMAMPGSDLFVSAPRAVGAVLVSTQETELAIVGCFWRLDDYLITAKHVANAVGAGIADVYLTNATVQARDVSRVNMRAVRVPRELFDVDDNVVQAEIDVFAVKLDPKMWAKIGVTRASVKKNSVYNQQICAVGFVNEILMTSNGKTLPGSGHIELWHTASTNKGFSGSPLFSGNSVVGMHVAGQSSNNIAVRVEQILLHLPKQVCESNMPEYHAREQSWKYRGREVDDFEDDYGHHLITSDGRVVLGLSDEEFQREFPSKRKSRYQEFIEEEEEEQQRNAALIKKFSKPPTKGDWAYEDECVKLKPPFIEELPQMEAVHCNSTPKIQPEIEAYLADCAEELEKLGFDKSKYEYPEITAATECTSLIKHLQLYEKRTKTITQPPTEQETVRCVHILEAMLSANKFEPNKDYKTKMNLASIIDSSAVKSSKSPGQPYQADGLTTNEQVLKKLGKSGVVEKVLNEWEMDRAHPIQLKNFCKPEAHKRSKLESGMLRIISGLPLHKMIKHQAVFQEMLGAAITNWKESPIKYGFAPSSPGHIEHLVRYMGGRVIYEADKTNWDYMFYPYLFKICKEVTVNLAQRPDSMSEAEFDAYIKDVRESIDEVNENCVFRCTNGRVFKVPGGVMKSGYLLTIFLNSMAQLVCDVLVKIRCGLTDEQILSEDYRIFAGGDDTNQTFPAEFDVTNYQNQAKLLGIEIEFEKHADFDGSSFFSTEFKKREGIWKFYPMRFTKHIEKLRRTKLSDLPAAISSHMANYCWDDRRFTLFEQLWKRGRRDHPDLFTLNFHKSRQFLRYKSKGMECDA